MHRESSEKDQYQYTSSLVATNYNCAHCMTELATRRDSSRERIVHDILISIQIPKCRLSTAYDLICIFLDPGESQSATTVVEVGDGDGVVVTVFEKCLRL